MAAIDFAFDPKDVTIAVGDSVSWTNTGAQQHNVQGDEFFGPLAPDATYSEKFEKAGRYDYICSLHPTQMTGTITVR